MGDGVHENGLLEVEAENQEMAHRAQLRLSRLEAGFLGQVCCIRTWTPR